MHEERHGCGALFVGGGVEPGHDGKVLNSK
jgi:hypothetical protein